MKISVSLYTILAKYGKDKIADDGTVEVADVTTLGQLSDWLGVPPRIAKVYLVDGLHKESDYILEDLDEVKILAFIGGG